MLPFICGQKSTDSQRLPTAGRAINERRSELFKSYRPRSHPALSAETITTFFQTVYIAMIVA